MGYPMKLELTRLGGFLYLANHYTSQGLDVEETFLLARIANCGIS